MGAVSGPATPSKSPMRVAVVGTGHVGLVTCVTFARMGHRVVGIDHDLEKLERIRSGIAPFFEPGLQELLTEGLASGMLSFESDFSVALRGAEVALVCVGTPPRLNGEANLVAVESAVRDIARAVTGPLVIVEKSTVPFGTAARARETVRHERPDIYEYLPVASNPEFLREGSAVEDSLNPDRVLVGADDEAAFASLRRLYAPLTNRGVPLIETDVATAEIAKHACNAFLALKVSYANALSRICELSGADITRVVQVMAADPRISPHFLNAGIGFGGSCFPKDLLAFERLAARLGYDFALLREIARINDEAVAAAVDKVKDALWNLEDKTVALLGLAFKPGTDDVRFAPALGIARALLNEGARVVGYDPQAGPNAKAELPDLELSPDPYGALQGAHCAVLCTEWPELANLDLDRARASMSYGILVDGRNLFDAPRAQAAGFTYYPTGRPVSRPGAVPTARAR